MKTSSYIDYEKLLKDVINSQLANDEINSSYYEDKEQSDYDKFLNTIKYLESFFYKIETINCSIENENLANICLLFNSHDEENTYSLNLSLSLDEEWISDFSFN